MLRWALVLVVGALFTGTFAFSGLLGGASAGLYAVAALLLVASLALGLLDAFAARSFDQAF